jgi:hypothetical protein
MTITLAASPFVILQLTGHTLAYVNAQPELTWADANALLAERNARLLAKIANTPANVTKLDDPRMKFHGELVTIQEIQFRRSKGMQDHWLGRAMVDDTWLYVDIWPEQVDILKEAGYGVGDFRPIARWVDVSYTVYLKWENSMLKIASAVGAGRMVA